MRIAILYICTGKYSIFWNKFYDSCQEYFLSNEEKHYFVFTNDDSIKKTEIVHTVFQAPRGFPLDSLMRFEMFMSVEEELKKFDYIFFFNANVQFVSPIGKEILPEDDNEGLVGVLHPGYLNSSPFWMPYERRKKSTAYMSTHIQRYYYYLGGINGGITLSYLKMIKTCRKNIQDDLDKGYVAFYHDESHINRYFAEKKILQLSPSYGYPEGWNLPFEPKILLLNKIKHGGEHFDKLPSKSYLKRGKLFIKRLIAGILWYF